MSRRIRATTPVKADHAAKRRRLGSNGGRPHAFDPELYRQVASTEPPKHLVTYSCCTALGPTR
ncbi:hypothetical protein ABZS66_61700 [Dactylosporangium sp. NPDC005572]|uniref:hypothetical protein n=1 Tax=Dactylosporangium sp. NPDC005572 TaxID=3156889 RepID=UPI00339FDA23